MSLLPKLGIVATWQWNNIEEKKDKKWKEVLKKNGERCYVWLTIIGHSAV